MQIIRSACGGQGRSSRALFDKFSSLLLKTFIPYFLKANIKYHNENRSEHERKSVAFDNYNERLVVRAAHKECVTQDQEYCWQLMLFFRVASRE